MDRTGKVAMLSKVEGWNLGGVWALPGKRDLYLLGKWKNVSFVCSQVIFFLL